MLLPALLLAAAQPSLAGRRAFVARCLDFAQRQTEYMLSLAGQPTGRNYPRTTDERDSLVTTPMREWTTGFFPGTLWYLYELTGEVRWRTEAEAWTHSLLPLKTYTGNHDIGFMMYCSYGQAQRLAPQPGYPAVLVESARSLATRYSPKTGVIRSWNGFRPWDDSGVVEYPVIIDNMMNLELLLYAARESGDTLLSHIARSHADRTLQNHFRPDGSSYHVVGYNALTGAAERHITAQGYADGSTWSRGQAWAVYGYTMMYRETRDERYLQAACRSADYFLARLPADMVPLWDFQACQPGYQPGQRSYAREYCAPLRDVSAAAVVCSALFELHTYAPRRGYGRRAVRMLRSLASDKYRARVGENGGFLLMHSVGSLPHHTEIDRPLVYADYYFLEALKRYRDMQ